MEDEDARGVPMRLVRGMVLIVAVQLEPPQAFWQAHARTQRDSSIVVDGFPFAEAKFALNISACCVTAHLRNTHPSAAPCSLR